ncbi:MAG: cyclase family protein [Saprospiraceae bacterium]|nr:cyclase family protein [Saprospiraceae bacterium]
MIIQLTHNQNTYEVDLSKPIDISIPLIEDENQVNCFYAPFFETAPVRMGDFVGSTAEGGAVNFLNVRINPHGNGTHTECVGHIAKEHYSINKCLKNYHKIAKLHTVIPTILENGDRVILKNQLEHLLEKNEVEAIIIRTIPNHLEKQNNKYSGTNPTFVHHEAIQYLVSMGIQHLLIDLPSVDREEDGGKLLAHKAFWQYPENTRENCTITELIYVDDKIKDGIYFLNLQIASFEIDVSPSKPILYQLHPKN